MINPFKQYIDYIKDNPKGYWFKRKLYGWGWTPATREGWAVMLIFLSILFFNFLRLDEASHSAGDTLRPFVIQTFALVIVLIIVCWRTGEPPKWKWGFGKKEDDKR